MLLRAPAGHHGIVLLGAPTAPVAVGFGVLSDNPAAMLLLNAGVQGEQSASLIQMLHPDDPRLRVMPVALQALSGVFPRLSLRTRSLDRAASDRRVGDPPKWRARCGYNASA